MEIIFVQILGFMALGLGMISFQFANPRHTMAVLLMSETIWTIHYVFLGAFVGAFITVLNAIKYGISSRFGDSSMYITLILYLAFIWGGYYFFFLDEPHALMLGTGSTLGAIGCFMRDKPQTFRLIMLLSCVPWVAYSYKIGSLSSLIDDICIATSIAVGIIRHTEIYQRKAKALNILNIKPISIFGFSFGNIK